MRRFARRDPKSWTGLALYALFLTAAGSLVYWLQRDTPYMAQMILLLSSGVLLATYWWWQWSVQRYVRRIASPPGTQLTSEFGPDSFKIGMPDKSFELPYASLTHVVQFEDVLVLKPKNHLILALPMELVPPQDLALIRSKVVNRPMREVSLG